MCLFSFLLAVCSSLRKAWRRGPSHLWRWFVYFCVKCVCQCKGKEWKSKFDHTHPDYVINVVENLPSVVQTGDALFLSVFLIIYPFYITTWDLLYLIMKRYPYFDPDKEMHERKKRAIMLFLSMWMENVPSDFIDDLDMAMLKKLVDYVHHNMQDTGLLKQLSSLFSLKRRNSLQTQDTGSSTSGMQERLDRLIAVLQENIYARLSAASASAPLLEEETEWKSKFDHTHPDYVKNVVDNLADNVLSADGLFLSVFLSIYRLYTTTWDLLDMIMNRYPRFDMDNELHNSEKRAITFFLSVWIDEFSEEFTENPDMDMVNKLKFYVTYNIQNSDLRMQVFSLFSTENPNN